METVSYRLDFNFYQNAVFQWPLFTKNENWNKARKLGNLMTWFLFSLSFLGLFYNRVTMCSVSKLSAVLLNFLPFLLNISRIMCSVLELPEVLLNFLHVCLIYWNTVQRFRTVNSAFKFSTCLFNILEHCSAFQNCRQYFWIFYPVYLR